jgi:hypothetical protein
MCSFNYLIKIFQTQYSLQMRVHISYKTDFYNCNPLCFCCPREWFMLVFHMQINVLHISLSRADWYNSYSLFFEIDKKNDNFIISMVSWDMTVCNLLDRQQHFRGACWLSLQGKHSYLFTKLHCVTSHKTMMFIFIAVRSLDLTLLLHFI